MPPARRARPGRLRAIPWRDSRSAIARLVTAWRATCAVRPCRRVVGVQREGEVAVGGAIDPESAAYVPATTASRPAARSGTVGHDVVGGPAALASPGCDGRVQEGCEARCRVARDVLWRDVEGDLDAVVAIDVAGDDRKEGDHRHPDDEQHRADQEASGPDPDRVLAAGYGRDVARCLHDEHLGRCQRPFLDVERAHTFDEDLLERRVGDLEAEDVLAAGPSPPEGPIEGPPRCRRAIRCSPRPVASR